MKKIILLIISFFISFLSFAQYDIDSSQHYTYEDISTTGTLITPSDDGYVNITTPYNVYLRGQATTDLRIGNNGIILFGTTTGSVANPNTPLVDLPAGTKLIAPFWDDFDTEVGGVYYETKTEYFNGFPIASQFIIQWDRVHYNGSTNTDPVSFQVVFNRDFRNIIFKYADTDMDGTDNDDAKSATIGIATQWHNDQYSFNSASLDVLGVDTLVFTDSKSPIHDDAFENYLETHNFEGYSRDITDDDNMGDGVANNNEVFTYRIDRVAELNISGLGIVSLTDNGELGDFRNLTELNCNDNQLTGILFFTLNIHLNKLQCKNNDLTEIATNTCSYLNYFDCSGNENLTTISIINNGYLQTLNISNTNISQIDDTDGDSDKELKFEHHPLLRTLSCVDISNDEFSLDLSYVPQLVSLDCSENNIERLTLPASNSHLKYLTMDNVWGYTRLINVPVSTLLETIQISGTVKGDDNDLLDLSNCSALQILWLHSYGIDRLDLRGATANIVSGGFDLKDSKSLHCTYVDNVAAAQSSWSNKIDYGNNFLLNETACANRLVYVPDWDFEHYLETHDGDGNVRNVGDADTLGNGTMDDYVYATKIETLYSMNSNSTTGLNNLTIDNLTGIEGFSELVILKVAHNNLSSLDLSNNKWLREVDCSDNDLLSITLNEKVKELDCSQNELSTIDISNQFNLKILDCSDNDLTSIDFSTSTNYGLRNFNCSNNQLSTFNLANYPYLGRNDDYYTGKFDCSNNDVDVLDLSNNINIFNLNCSNNEIASLDLTNNGELAYLECFENRLTSLTLGDNENLVHLTCQNNSIAALNLSQVENLKILDCSSNQLNALDLSNNSHIYNLNCSVNYISSLDLDHIDFNGSGWFTYPALNVKNNALTELHIQNGNNDIFSSNGYFEAQNNPNLTCIYVDNAADATDGINDYEYWIKDVDTTYVETTAECNALDNVSLQVKVFLQGPSLNPTTAGLMNDDLRSLDYLPTTSPYSDGLTVSATVFDVTGNDAIVDWIWVELRDGEDETSIIHGQSALLQRDGHIVALDGVSLLTIEVSPATYYVVIKHRNHLGIMSSNAINLISSGLLIDFTDDSINSYGNNAQVSINGVNAMWAGDTSNENKVKVAGTGNGAVIIKDAVLSDPSNGFNLSTFTSTGYLAIDVDLNGGGKYVGTGNDKNILKDNVLTHPSNGFGLSTYTIFGTVPVATLARTANQENSIINIYLPPSEEVRRANEALINNNN